jgi:hypothetical protein
LRETERKKSSLQENINTQNETSIKKTLIITKRSMVIN